MEKNKKEKKRVESKDATKLTFFIKTTKKNYIKNISISLLFSIFLSYIAYFRGWSNISITFTFLLSFVFLYRIIEYLLTGKTLSPALYAADIIDERNKSLGYMIFFVIGLLLVLFMILFANPL